MVHFFQLIHRTEIQSYRNNATLIGLQRLWQIHQLLYNLNSAHLIYKQNFHYKN